MQRSTEAYVKGLELMNKLHGGHAGEALVNSMNEICPDYVTITVEMGFGKIFSRESLDIKTRELAIIASCVTLGHAMPQLLAHIEAAFNVGATKDEVIEVILQTSLYAGFPAVTNAFTAASHLLKN